MSLPCLLSCLLGACTAEPPGGVRVVSPPELQLLEAVPLARLLTVAGDVPTTLVVEASSETEHLQITWPEPALAHEVPLLGLKPDRTWLVTVWLLDGRRRTLAGRLQVVTDPLPAHFPHLDVLAHDRARAEPGYRLADVKFEAAGPDLVVAFDVRDLEVAWIHVGPPAYNDLRRTPRGTLIGFHTEPVEIDLLGRPIRRWTASPSLPHDRLLLAEAPHHELFPLGDGSFLTLEVERHRSEAYPSRYGEPLVLDQAADLLSAAVVRFLDDGTVVSRWSLASLLDDGRIGFDALRPEPGGLDWLHANAVIPHPDGGVVVSLRHQDALIRLDHQGSLAWILGDPAGWGPGLAPLLLERSGDWPWFYHPHAPTWLDDDTLLLFDNHNDGHTPYDGPPDPGWHSRVIALQIDEATQTVRQLWAYHPEGPELQSDALGDADPLPITGNVLADFGFITAEGGQPNHEHDRAPRTVRLIEFDPDAPSPPVLDLDLWNPASAPGVKTFRAEAIPSLYPDDVEVISTLR